MRYALKAKKAYTDDEVARVFADIRSYVTAAEVEHAVDRAVREIHTVIGRRALDRCVYGWSGGKDSIALQVVMEAAGVQRAVLGCVPGLEFTSYMEWLPDHLPEGVHVYGNDALDLKWLAAHPQYLFPRTAKLGYFWTTAGTRRAQLAYQQQYQPLFQIYGRRYADGNQCGDRQGISRARNGITSYNPIRAWSHEMVLAVIAYYQRPLPPTYRWPHGWTAGTGPWPGRRVGTIDESWAETWAIEPMRVVDAAAARVPGAREWMEAAGHAG